MNKLSKVNLLQGTASVEDYSTGNTLPIVARPWGMHHWTLQTQCGSWPFHPSHRKIQGVRLTHRPSPWMGEYGSVLIAPFNDQPCSGPGTQASSWRIKDAIFRPNYLMIESLRYGIRLEMSPTNSGAMFDFTSSRGEPICVRFFFDGRFEVRGQPPTRVFEAVARDNQGGVAENFGLYLSGEFSVRPDKYVPTSNGGFFVFPREVRHVRMSICGSFISQEMARVALERDVLGRGLEALVEEGEDVWNSLLNRISINANDETQERTFYSCLYRCLLFPRFLDEVDGDGCTVHYSPYDGHIHSGSLCADSGFWDTYRTLYPLLTLVYPDVLVRMLKGWVNACRQAGWSPRWPNPGGHDCMIGTHFNSVVADAVGKGIVEWPVEEAFEYLKKDSALASGDPRYGREGIEDYVRLGYVPGDRWSYSVSRTLDYCYDDFCVLQVAEFLGDKELARSLEPRVRFYRNLFDRRVGFMRARTANGDWMEPFDPIAWGGPYVEGAAWQHLFNVPHDPSGLADLFGGAEKLCEKLDGMLHSEPSFNVGSYKREIHEMTEMGAASFGQYAHSNQPVHGYLFLYGMLGRANATEYWTRRVAEDLYTPDSFPGDEDNGEMSAWYVLVSLGLYPLCPGKSEYLRFKPLVKQARLRVPETEISISGDLNVIRGIVSHADILKQSESSCSSVLVAV